MVEKLYGQFDPADRGYLNYQQFKIFISSVFDLNMRRHSGRDHYRRILLKLGKGEYDNIQKDLIVDFIVERGAFEFRNAEDDENFEESKDEGLSFLDSGGLQNETLTYFSESQRPNGLSIYSKFSKKQDNLKQSLISMGHSVRHQKTPWKEVWAKRLKNPTYNYVLTMVQLAYTLVLYVIDMFNIQSKTERNEIGDELPALILTIIFLVDLVANIVVVGIKSVLKERKELVLEIFLQLFFWTSFIIDILWVEDRTVFGTFLWINAVF